MTTPKQFERRQEMRRFRKRAAKDLPRPGATPGKTSAPLLTFNLPTAAARAGSSLRRARYYLEAGLLPPAKKRGPGAAYDEAWVDRLRAVEALRGKRVSLAGIRKQLAKASPEAIRAIAGIAPPPASAAATSPSSADVKPAASKVEPAAPVLRAPKAITYVAERWERVVLVPGLSLVVERDSVGLRRLAQQIVDAFGSA